MTFYQSLPHFTPDAPMVTRPRRTQEQYERPESHSRPKDKRDDYKRRPRNFKGWDDAGEDE